MDGLAIAASMTEVRAAAEGGFIDAVYQPTKSTLVLHVSGASRVRLLISPRQAAIHLTQLPLPNPQTPTTFVMFLRRHLRGGRIVAVRQLGWDRVVVFEVERRDGRRTKTYELVAELTGVRGNLHLLERGVVARSAHRDRRNRPGEPYASLRVQPKLDPASITLEQLAAVLADEPEARALARALDGVGRNTAEDLLRDAAGGTSPTARSAAVCADLQTIVDHVGNPSGYVLGDDRRATFYPPPTPAEPQASFGAALDAVSEAASEQRENEPKPIRNELQRAIARHTRTLQKLEDWLDGADEADRLQSLADLVMIHQSDIAPKAEQATLADPATGLERTIRLIPSLSAIENAQRMYERAKRLRRGRPHVMLRIERLRAEIPALERALEQVDAGQAIDEVAAHLLPGKRTRTLEPAPSRHRMEVDGFTIKIGRSARDNDRLLREAAPDDLWLHAKGYAGSHVVVRRGGRREIPDAVVRRAARLAAKHSKASGERRVEVVVTEAKHVRKPKGAPEGLANVLQSATLTVEM